MVIITLKVVARLIKYLYHTRSLEFFKKFKALIAQSVEQRIENPRVPGSIPGQGTIFTLSEYKGPQFIAGLFYLKDLNTWIYL